MGIGGFGMGELIVIFLVALLLFGAKRLPEIGSSLGKGIREFKGSVREIEHEIKAGDTSQKATPPPPPATEQGEPRKLSDGDPESSSDESTEDV
jgi:sec-independent protein translocase protein TatA